MNIRSYAVLIALMLFLCTLVGYLARVNVSVALPFIADDYGWSQGQLGELGGLLLGIFLVGYGISNILISPLVDYFGPRKGLMVSVSLWSLFTLLTGALGAIYSIIILSRLMLGLSQGILFPSASKATQAWFPPYVRSRVNALYLSSGFASNLLAPLVLLPLILVTSWEIMFFVVALLGFLLLIPIWRIVKDTPEGEARRERVNLKDLLAETWENIRKALRVKGLLLLTFAFLCVNVVWWGFSLWMPTYLEGARGFPINDLVWAASLPYLGGMVGMYFGSWISDRTGKRALLTATFMALCAATLMVVSITQSKEQILFVMALLWFFLGIAPVNVFTILQSLVEPEMMSSATGIVNGVANGAGIIGPMIIGMAVALTGSYDLGLVIMAGAIALGILFILPFRRLDRSPE